MSKVTARGQHRGKCLVHSKLVAEVEVEYGSLAEWGIALFHKKISLAEESKQRRSGIKLSKKRKKSER